MARMKLYLMAVFLGGSWAMTARAEHDVVVYGGTSAGVISAVQAKRMGKTVVLIEPTDRLGGLSTSGLGWTDTGDKAVIGGLAREFYRRVKQHYDRDEAWTFGRREDYKPYRREDDAMYAFEPHVAERIFQALVREHQVEVVLGERLDRQPGRGIVKQDGRLRALVMESGRQFPGRMFIDATYEGDLLPAAGVSYTVGREANAQYGETLNGVARKWNRHNHRFLKNVSPYLIPGDAASGLLPGIEDRVPDDGEADHRVQAYCFRMCLSRNPANRVPFAKPEGYDEREYELLFRNFEAGDLRLPLHNVPLPNGKTDTNNNGAVSTDFIGRNFRYPEGSYGERAALVKQHATYQQGLMWALAHHPRVPEQIRREMAEWGLARDEFAATGHWPPAIYVREARRMVGVYVQTEQDCRRTRDTPASVGMGSYNMDSHNCLRYVTAEGFVQNEGDVQESPRGAYAISYFSIVPKKDECTNLLVPVCLSSSHIAYGSIRMEPVFMILAQSAATAAVLALDAGLPVQEVDVARLQARLRQDGQVLEHPAGRAPPAK